MRAYKDVPLVSRHADDVRRRMVARSVRKSREDQGSRHRKSCARRVPAGCANRRRGPCVPPKGPSVNEPRIRHDARTFWSERSAVVRSSIIISTFVRDFGQRTALLNGVSLNPALRLAQYARCRRYCCPRYRSSDARGCIH